MRVSITENVLLIGLLLCALSAAAQIPQPAVTDTTRAGTDTTSREQGVREKEPFSFVPRTVRVGWDGLASIRGAVTPQLSTAEGRIEVDFKKYIAVFEAGFWNNHLTRYDSTVHQDPNQQYLVYDYDIRGRFIRVGLDYNFLHRSEERSVFSFGLRYGRAWQDEQLDFELDHPDWGLILNNSAANTGLNAYWFELLLGFQVRVHPLVTMGYSGRLKIRPTYQQGEFVPFEIAGFGRSETSSPTNQNWGFNYYLLFNLDFKREQ